MARSRAELGLPLRTVALVVLLLAGCSSSRPARRTNPTRPSTVEVGTCADPARDGVVSASPRFRTGNRDLNGDGQLETIVADEALCSSDGNCHWNLFAVDESGCQRYLGTISGASLQQLPRTGDRSFADLRGWWRFSGGKRLLMSEYRFRRGGYRVVDALVCRLVGGKKIECAAPDS